MKKNNKKNLLLTPEKLVDLSDLEAIKYVLDKMKEHLIRAAVHPKTFEYVWEAVEKLAGLDLLEARVFFVGLFADEWEKTRIAWNFLPIHAWSNYETLFGENNSPEHQHLMECLLRLRRRWEQRPVKRPRKKKS